MSEEIKESVEETVAEETEIAAEEQNAEAATEDKEEKLDRKEKKILKKLEGELADAMARKMYADGVASQLANVPAAQLSAMLTQLISSSEEKTNALRFDEYVPSEFSEYSYKERLELLGEIDMSAPSGINIYADTFEDKDKLSDLIAEYNSTAAEEDKISYTDIVALAMSGISTIINVISYVLIAFVSISLVVSSIMISIITYISVLERTKEIGILRAIGASKGDISRVFNAETLIVGFVSGFLGIATTIILCIPITAVVRYLTGIGDIAAELPLVAAVVLVGISMFLTFIAGLVPAKIAANKDPVVALRSE